MKNRSDLGQYLNARGLRGKGAEIGVFAGDFSLQLLNAWRGTWLYLIDAWEVQPPREYQDEHNVEQARFDAMLEQLPRKLSAHAGRYEIIRAFSHEAAQRIADGSLDFVYIDAN